jgi:cardiolipin synthase A/B
MAPHRHSGLKKTLLSRGKTPGLSDVSSVHDLREKGRAFVRARGWLQTILLLIGLITVLAVLGALFVGAGASPDSIYTESEVAPVDSALFATSLSHLVNAPFEHGGSVWALKNGDEFVPALLNAIDHAKHSINFSVYIWADGEFSKQVLSALIRARSHNVAVRVLLDDFGSIDEPFWKFGDLEKAGARIERFRTPQFGKWTRLHRRDHRRAIVIDGEVGFTGGMAVKDTWLGNAQDPAHWRDMMFKVTGPMARSLQAAFVNAWAGSCGEILVGPDMYPNAGESVPGVSRFIHLVNSPAADDYAMGEFFIVPILAARQSLFIVTPYFIPDVHLQSALVKKAREGVDVRLLVPGKHIDSWVPWFIAQSHYEALLDAGVRIYEYRPTFLHSKFMVVDRQWSVIGSSNLDYRSRQLDEENAYGILDRGLAEELHRTFLADIERSDEIKAGEWRNRNPFLRVMQRLSQLFELQS